MKTDTNMLGYLTQMDAMSIYVKKKLEKSYLYPQNQLIDDLEACFYSIGRASTI